MSKSLIHRSFAGSKLGFALSVMGLAATSTSVQAAPTGMYLGGAAGVSINERPCGEFDVNLPGVVCDRASTGGKWFGGYYLSPGVGAELSYLRFATVNRRKASLANSRTPGDLDYAEVQDSTSAVTLGLNIEMELFQSFTNHLRLGWSWAQHNTAGYRSVVTASSPYYQATDLRSREYRGAPYFGAGLSGKLSPNVRLFSGWDFLIDGRKSNHLLSAGIQAEWLTNQSNFEGASRSYGALSMVASKAGSLCNGMANCKDKSIGWRATLGNRFSKYVAGEMALTDVRLGKVNSTGGASLAKANGRVFSWAAVGRLPVVDGVQAVARLGAAAVKADGEFSGMTPASKTYWSTRPLIGVGVEAEVAPGVKVFSSVERTKYKLLDVTDSLQMISLGAQADF